METSFLSSGRQEVRTRELRTSQCHLNPCEDDGDNPNGKYSQTSPIGGMQHSLFRNLFSILKKKYFSILLGISQLFPLFTKENLLLL